MEKCRQEVINDRIRIQNNIISSQKQEIDQLKRQLEHVAENNDKLLSTMKRIERQNEQLLYLMKMSAPMNLPYGLGSY